MLRARPRTTSKAAILIAVISLVSGSAAPGADVPGPLRGMALAEALRSFEAYGFEIFFTSNLVRPEMRVEAEPTADDPRQALEQILAPHGLKVVTGPGGRLVVVAAEPEPATLRGVARVRLEREPIPGVRIFVPGLDAETWSGEDGSFELADVPPGRHLLEAHLPGFVVQRLEVTAAAGEVTEISLEMEPAPLELDEIVVTPSRITLLREEPVSALDLDRDTLFALPHLGDDIFRALTLMPGVTGEEVSARLNVRGGRGDEVLVLLDQVELFEPYHLKDYSSSLSIITPQALREVTLITGGFPAQYGDRMSGVLDMSTLEPESSRTHLGLGVLSAEIGRSGTFAEGRGHYLASLRRGNLDLALDFLGSREKPRYWDTFGKVEYQPRPAHRLGAHVLHSDDDLDFDNVDPDTTERYLTSYGNSYLWLTHQALLGTRLFVDSTASLGRVERDRRGIENELEPDDVGEGFSLFDERRLDVVGFKQDWDAQASDRHYLGWGFEVRQLETDYDYLNERELDDPLEEYRSQPRTGTTSLRKRLRGEQYSLYLGDRWRPLDAFTLELGLRYDEHTLTDDRHVSPRINLVHALGPASTLRAAWGYFYQSQRPYELQVEDGVTELTSAERTEQRVLGFEHSFGGPSKVLLRVEAYQRLITDPRPRYENVFEPISIFPEIEPDRFLIAPERSEGYGLETFLRGSRGRLDWWVSYTLSKIEDLVDGRWVPRRIDQRHAVSLDLNWRLGKHWNLNLAWRYHTGWPTTAFSGRFEEDDEGEVEIVTELGPLFGERLPDYHRLDLRTSREWQRRKGTLGFYVEIQNLYHRENVAGFDVDFEFTERPDGTIAVTAIEEVWGGFLPSFGITWDF